MKIWTWILWHHTHWAFNCCHVRCIIENALVCCLFTCFSIICSFFKEPYGLQSWIFSGRARLNVIILIKLFQNESSSTVMTTCSNEKETCLFTAVCGYSGRRLFDNAVFVEMGQNTQILSQNNQKKHNYILKCCFQHVPLNKCFFCPCVWRWKIITMAASRLTPSVSSPRTSEF